MTSTNGKLKIKDSHEHQKLNNTKEGDGNEEFVWSPEERSNGEDIREGKHNHSNENI